MAWVLFKRNFEFDHRNSTPPKGMVQTFFATGEPENVRQVVADAAIKSDAAEKAKSPDKKSPSQEEDPRAEN